METFWKTIALYNSSTWVYQLIITLTGICLTAYLIKKPCRRSIISMKIFLIALYLWISIVYFYIYCAERSYNMSWLSLGESLPPHGFGTC